MVRSKCRHRLAGLPDFRRCKPAQVTRAERGEIVLTVAERRTEGGMVDMPPTRTFQCYECRHEWTVPYGTGRPQECPACRSQNICRAEAEQGLGGPGAGAGPRQRCRCGQAKP